VTSTRRGWNGGNRAVRSPDVDIGYRSGVLVRQSSAPRTIDVAGLADVELRCPRTWVTIPRLGLNELADSPLQKVGFLYASRSRSMPNPPAPTPTATPGSARRSPMCPVTSRQVPRKIDQLLQNGGTITLAAAGHHAPPVHS